MDLFHIDEEKNNFINKNSKYEQPSIIFNLFNMNQ